MERKQSFIEDGSRYQFDNTLLDEGYHQRDSEQDTWYFGTWFNPAKLTLVEYAEGDLTIIKFDDVDEFVGWVSERQETMRYLHIDDWTHGAVPIEREALHANLAGQDHQ